MSWLTQGRDYLRNKAAKTLLPYSGMPVRSSQIDEQLPSPAPNPLVPLSPKPIVGSAIAPTQAAANLAPPAGPAYNTIPTQGVGDAGSAYGKGAGFGGGVGYEMPIDPMMKGPGPGDMLGGMGLGGPAPAQQQRQPPPANAGFQRQSQNVYGQSDPWLDPQNMSGMMNSFLTSGYMNTPGQMVGDLNDAFAEQTNANADRVNANGRLSMILNALQGVSGGGQGGGRLTGFQDTNSPQGGSTSGQYTTNITAGGLPNQALANATAGVAGRPVATTPTNNFNTIADAKAAGFNLPADSVARMQSLGIGGSPAAHPAATRSLPNVNASPQFAGNMARLGSDAATQFGRTAGAANNRLNLASQTARSGQGSQIAELMAALSQDNTSRDVARQRMIMGLI